MSRDWITGTPNPDLEPPRDVLHGDELLGLLVPHQPRDAEVAGADVLEQLVPLHGSRPRASGSGREGIASALAAAESLIGPEGRQKRRIGGIESSWRFRKLCLGGDEEWERWRREGFEA